MTARNAVDGRHMRGRFSAHAADYDGFASVQKRVVDRLVRQLAETGFVRGPLLDIGTGTGALAELLGRQLPAASLAVMDIAHGMTLQARRRLGGVAACDADACALPFRDAAFATAVSSSVYQWVADLPLAFAEAERILRPEGLFAGALFGERTLEELRCSHRRALAQSGTGHQSHVHEFPAPSEVRQALDAAGLRILSITTYRDVEYHTDVASLLRQLKRIGASNASPGRPRGLASRQVMREMMREYEETYRQAEGLPATYEVILFQAVKSSAAGDRL